MELRPHQRIAVDKMHNGCVLAGDVGSGKTFTSLWYFYSKVMGGVPGDLGSIRTPMDIYVITTAKTRDAMSWHSTAADLGISTNRENSIEGVKLTVDSWNNIGKYTDVENAFFIFDEQRLVGTGAWTKSYYKIAKRNRWIMLSATPGDVWLDYAAVFIGNGFYKNITEFREKHVVYSPYHKHPKVLRYNAVGTLVRHRNAVLVEMPFLRHTKRHIEYIECDYDVALIEKVVKERWHVYETRPLRDVAELFSVMRKVVNSDSSRTKTVSDLLKKHRKLIVFYNFNYELEALRSLASNVRASTTSSSTNSSSGQQTTKNDASERCLLSNSHDSGESWAVAEWNGHKHEPIPDTDRWLYLVQYVAGAEGWNCTSTDAMCLYSQTYSYKNDHQALGRIDRLDTPYTDLYYYRLISKAPIDLAIKKSLRMKKNFQERDFHP